MERIEMNKVVLSPEAQDTVEGMKEKLRLFSKLIKKREEPEVWGELGDAGVLVVKIKANTAKGKVEAKLNIPADHWDYVH